MLFARILGGEPGAHIILYGGVGPIIAVFLPFASQLAFRMPLFSFLGLPHARCTSSTFPLLIRGVDLQSKSWLCYF